MTKILLSPSGRLSSLFALAALVLAAGSGSALSCSIFSIQRADETVYGQNLDWHRPFPGCVIVNKRGVPKQILPWKGWWPAPHAGDPFTWVSKYGSVTFTCYGRDFVEGGMNEKGLAIDETNLVSVYEPGDGRPGVSCAQWIQYQLDNFATVGEVIEHLDDLRLDGEGWHFLVADADGRSAVLEFPGGEIKVITGGDLSVSALTNTTHEQAMSHVPMDAAFGGELDIATGSGSYGRFVKMAAMIRDYDPARDGKGDDYAFRILEAVRCENTLRSVVYDAGRGRVSWTTPGNRERRWLDFANLDLTLATPTRMVDVEAGGPGDVAGLLEDYTTGKNRMIVDGVLGKSRDDRRIVDKLAARGMTVDEAIERIVNNPVEPVGMKRRKP